MVLNPTQLPNNPKAKRLDDLTSELGSDVESIRDNEGEAANYGVYFDDTEYDYMQHLRDLGSGSGEAVFVESEATLNKGKGKQRQSLAEALGEMDLQERSSDLLHEDILPSKNLQRVSYQVQQDVPDSIAGLQPDMDPRLREVLEALDDDAFMDDNEDVFKELAEDGQEIDDYDFQEAYPDDDDDAWESDDTAKPDKEDMEDRIPNLVAVGAEPDHGPMGGWLEDFNKFKKDQKSQKKVAFAANPEMESSVLSTTTNGGRRKKRKGALTNPSEYSMTSSSVARTEQLTLLDARFDKIDEEYNADMEDLGSVSEMSTSSVQGPTRSDFDSIMDEFLSNHSMQGKRNIKMGKRQTGLEQLDEIRKGLGPARIATRYR